MRACARVARKKANLQTPGKMSAKSYSLLQAYLPSLSCITSESSKDEYNRSLIVFDTLSITVSIMRKKCIDAVASFMDFGEKVRSISPFQKF